MTFQKCDNLLGILYHFKLRKDEAEANQLETTKSVFNI